LKPVLAAVRSRGDLALAFASSGVAALLMPGGQTGHSLFKIPLKVDEYSICSIMKQSLHAKMLRKAKVIMWDEAPMMHKHVFETLNRTLMDIVGNEKPFGGTTVFGGDLRQVHLYCLCTSCDSKSNSSRNPIFQINKGIMLE
jgi:ATP-dependent DNA helicase PIF1